MRTTTFGKLFAVFICVGLSACASGDTNDEDDRETVDNDEDRGETRRYGRSSRGSASDRDSDREEPAPVVLVQRQSPPSTETPAQPDGADEAPSRSQRPPRQNEPVAPRETLDWYTATHRGLRPEQVTPNSIPRRVRQAFRAREINANRENSWIVWASAWTRNGGRDGWALVEYLRLEAIMADGGSQIIYEQRYDEGDDIWGGWFPYNDQKWYKMGMTGENDFVARRLDLRRGESMVGACINTGQYTGRNLAAGHIWMMRWPRDVAPDGTVTLRVSARFVANGDALINVGLDRYRLDDADPEPQQECLVSDTYGGSHGPVEVTMETPRINWAR